MTQQLQQDRKQKQESEEISKREGKGKSLATSHMIYRIQNTDTYYVQSERSENIYYFVRYNFGVLEWCSCPDNSIRGIKCKHQFAIEYAIRLGTLKEIDKLPKEAKRFTNQQIEELELEEKENETSNETNHSGNVSSSSSLEVVKAVSYHSYRDDQYDF